METPQITPEQRERLQLLTRVLRSRKYRQTTGKLSRYDRIAKKRKFCCLGVACEVAKAAGLDITIRRDPERDIYSYNGSTEILPVDVMRWYGFDSMNPNLKTDAKHVPEHRRSIMTAAELNDENGLTFRQIADAIEKTYNLED